MTKRWLVQAEHYKWMGRHYPQLDWSDTAAAAMFQYESRGTVIECPWANGYYVGKHWLDWQINEWKAGLKDGTLQRWELTKDPTLPADVVSRV